MPKTRLYVLVAAIVVVLVAAGVLISRTIGGGGRPVSIDATVSGTTMTPSDLSATQGDRVTLRITIDRKEEIHLHGYDIKFEPGKPGETVTKTFSADKTGRFDIEIEDQGKVGTLTVKP